MSEEDNMDLYKLKTGVKKNVYKVKMYGFTIYVFWTVIFNSQITGY